jgi:hypothetical protein
MRVCPTVDGSSSPLIAHRIQVCECLGRQQAQYHKCFRCVYRGMAADWRPSAQTGGGAVMTPAGARGVPTITVDVPAPPAARQPRKGKKAPKQRASEPATSPSG